MTRDEIVRELEIIVKKSGPESLGLFLKQCVDQGDIFDYCLVNERNATKIDVAIEFDKSSPFVYFPIFLQ